MDINYQVKLKIANAVNRVAFKPGEKYLLSMVFNWADILSINLTPWDKLNPLGETYKMKFDLFPNEMKYNFRYGVSHAYTNISALTELLLKDEIKGRFLKAISLHKEKISIMEGSEQSIQILNLIK